MTRWPKRWCWQALWGLACASVAALASADALQSELEQIESVRQSVESDYARRDQECRHKLAVNACQKNVRIARIEAMRPLDQRRRELDALRRTEKANVRRAAIKERERKRGLVPEAEKVALPEQTQPQPQPQPLIEKLP